MLLVQLSDSFQSRPLLPTSKLGTSGAYSCVGGFVYILGLRGSPTNSPVRLGVSPTASTHTGFSVTGFEALFPHTGTLGCTVCLAQQFLPVYPQVNIGPPSLPAAAFLGVLSTPAVCLHPSY